LSSDLNEIHEEREQKDTKEKKKQYLEDQIGRLVDNFQEEK
jgi:hypothetical protein